MKIPETGVKLKQTLDHKAQEGPYLKSKRSDSTLTASPLLRPEHNHTERSPLVFPVGQNKPNMDIQLPSYCRVLPRRPIPVSHLMEITGEIFRA